MRVACHKGAPTLAFPAFSEVGAIHHKVNGARGVALLWRAILCQVPTDESAIHGERGRELPDGLFAKDISDPKRPRQRIAPSSRVAEAKRTRAAEIGLDATSTSITDTTMGATLRTESSFFGS